MGIFTRNYDKPGKGVDVNAPEKRGFFRFWEMFFEKFGGHLKANVVNFILGLPFLIIVIFFAPVHMITENISDQTMALEADYLLRMLMTALTYTLWGSGIGGSAYAYICKCHTVRKPVWVFSDGFGCAKQNFKQSIIVTIISFIMLHASVTGFLVYGSMFTKTGSTIFFVLRAILCMAILIFTWMQFFIYQVMTTMELKIGHVYKNSLLFALSSVPLNLLFTIISVAIVIVCFSFFEPTFALIMSIFVAPIFTRLPIEFYSARKLRKVISDLEEKRADEGEQL